MRNELISIVIPLYNKENSIAKTLHSIINQTYSNWELIVVDDGSSDNSANIVSHFLSDSRIHYYYKKNGGVSSSRNFGVSKSNGEWIVFLDADDYFFANALEILYSLATEMSVKVASANYFRERNSHKVKACFGRKKRVFRNNLKSYFFRDFSLRTGVALFHKEILRDIHFDESLIRYEDLKFILEIMKITRIAYDPRCVMVYSLDNLGLSHACKNIEYDFIFNMKFENKCFWEKIILGHLLWIGCNTYRGYVEELRKKYYRFWIYKDLSKCFNLYTRMKSFMRKINIGA